MIYPDGKMNVWIKFYGKLLLLDKQSNLQISTCWWHQSHPLGTSIAQNVTSIHPTVITLYGVVMKMTAVVTNPHSTIP